MTSTPAAAIQKRPSSKSFEQSPFLMFWETTRACDLACAHCRACAMPKPDPRELSTAEGKELLEDAKALGVRLVVLTGGDPAKREDLVELVEHGVKQGLRMALTPSATPLVTPQWLQQLHHAGLSRLAVSLDGAKASTHDRFRAVDGTYARTLRILDNARSLGLTTQVNTTVCRGNIAELPALADSLAQKQIELWSVFFLVPTGRANANEMLSQKETEEVLGWLADLAPQAPFDIKTTAAPHYRRVLLQRKVHRKNIIGAGDGIGRVRRGVNDGLGVVFVSHVGDIQPSGFLPVVCGNVREPDGLAKTYLGCNLFRSLRDPNELLGKCGDCEFRKVCGGSRARAYALTGNPFAQEPTCGYEPGRQKQCG